MEAYYDNPGIFLNTLLNQDEESEFIDEFKWMQTALKKLAQELKGQQDVAVDFIGAHPKSLSKAKLQQIKREQNGWLVCEKTDGVRYLLIILNNGHCFLTGRNVGGMSQSNEYQLHLVKIKVPSQLLDLQNLQIIEMFDGELIVENFPNNNQALNYLVFDTLIHQGQNISKLNYFERLRSAQEYLEQRRFLKKLSPLADIDYEPLKHFPKIRCILKDFFTPIQVRSLFQSYIPLLFHGNDGLIFTKNQIPYLSGTNENIVKWKPPEKNTIDFLLCPNKKIPIKDQNFGLLELYVMLTVKKEKQLLLFDFIQVKKEVIDQLNIEREKTLDKLEELGQIQSVKGVVAECKLERLSEQSELISKLYNLNIWGYDNSRIESFFENILKHSEHAFSQENQTKLKQIELLKEIRESVHLKFNFKFTWAIEKYRTDKTFPNSFMVAQNLLQIIGEDLKQQELVEILEKQFQM